MRKHIAVIIALVMAFSLCGCGSSKSLFPENTGNKQQTKTADSGSIKVGYLLSSDGDAPDTVARVQGIRKMQEETGIADGIKAIKHFTEKGIRTNCTLVFSVGQALLAAKAGATYVSPFVGRLDDICEDGVGLVGDIVRMYRTYDYKTQVLAASIRNTKHIIECVEVGADVATCPLSAIKGLLNHPLTDSGLKKFLEDYKKVNG